MRPLVVALLLMAPALASAQGVRQALVTWQNNATNADGNTLSRKDAHCSVPGPFVDLAFLAPTATSYLDPTSPFPYACYHVRATAAGVVDSGLSNDGGTTLPAQAAATRGHRLR